MVGVPSVDDVVAGAREHTCATCGQKWTCSGPRDAGLGGVGATWNKVGGPDPLLKGKSKPVESLSASDKTNPGERPSAFPDNFVEAAIKSGMREVICESEGCGKWFLTRTQTRVPDLCPPCRDKEAEIRRLVLGFFEGDAKKTEHWFRTENPLLGGIQPRAFLNLGRIDKVLKFVKEQLAENEPPPK